MKYVLWALLCAAGVTYLLILLNNSLGMSQWSWVSGILSYVHGYGMSGAQFAFVVLSVFFLITGLHRNIGRLIGDGIGCLWGLGKLVLIAVICYFVAKWLFGLF